jgi:hypothetical protein
MNLLSELSDLCTPVRWWRPCGSPSTWTPAPTDIEALAAKAGCDSDSVVRFGGGIGQCSGCRTRSSRTCLCKPDRTTPASPQCTPTDFTVAGG